MSSNSVAVRLSATALLAVLLTAASACGTKTSVDDLVPAAPGAGPSAQPHGKSPRALDADARRAAQGQASPRALDADARRAAQGQVPSPSPAPPGKRLPDTRP